MRKNQLDLKRKKACTILALCPRFILGIALSFCFLSPCQAHSWLKKSQQALEQNKHKLSPHSLNRYASWKNSQFGEDGIIEEIFKRLKIEKGFFVEFGGTDGVYLSNTRHLFQTGWEGVYIEMSANWFKKLQANYAKTNKVQCLHYFVTWRENDRRGLSFDEIKAKHFPDKEIDFLSIDIDGGDYYIFKDLKCRPKVISIENNLKWHPLYAKEVPEKVVLSNINQPLQVVIDQARAMGYEPVCATINLFLVRRDLYEPFENTPSDALALWRDAMNVLPKPGKKKRNPLLLQFEGQELHEQYPMDKLLAEF